MKSLVTKDLTIKPETRDGKIFIIWLGRSREMNPETILDPYLDDVVACAAESELIVDFSNLESMNSSTVPPILSFIKNLEKSNVTTKILYNGNLQWQRASFIPLSAIIKNYTYIEVVQKD